MAVLKKRWVAVSLAVLIIALSTAYGVNRSLGAEMKRISDSFYEGVYDKDWKTVRPSVSYQLDKRCSSASGLETVLGAYPELSDKALTLKEARHALLNLSGEDITDIYSANVELEQAFNAAVTALKDKELTEREQKMVSDYSYEFKGAQKLIESSGYNELVREFERTTLNVFPANILKNITFMEEPELFGN